MSVFSTFDFVFLFVAYVNRDKGKTSRCIKHELNLPFNKLMFFFTFHLHCEEDWVEPEKEMNR